VRAALDAAIAALNGTAGDLDTWRGLDALIAEQHWRAAHFRVAADDINYRRFFNINELAGIRMELPELFDHAHRTVFALLADGTLDGLRIDHVDGLLDPKGYLARLRERAPRPFYLVVEKILARHEALREDWPVDGTTGYEFANLLLGCSPTRRGRRRCPAPSRLRRRRAAFAEVVRDCKLRIMQNEMASELNVLARDAGRIARQNPRTADFTRNILMRGLREIVAAFPVYRTYVDADAAPTEADRRDLDWAVAQAAGTSPTSTPASSTSCTAALDRLVRQPAAATAADRDALRHAGAAVQRPGDGQGPRGHGLLPLQPRRRAERGGRASRPSRPRAAGLPPGQHAALRALAGRDALHLHPRHQARRGHRARLLVLTEMPEEWARNVRAWSRILRPAAATWRARRRPTATTNTCSTSSSSAPGRRS
jgi:(1->4)-alpha-D-glucan 1-alpha-D-glucosylmutase